MNAEVLIPTALLAGFFGSTHCIGMCGAIVVLFEDQLAKGDRTRNWSLRVIYNLGRFATYASLGAIAGAAGALLASAVGIAAGLLFLRLVAGLLVIAIGINLLGAWRFTDWLERAGARLWRGLSPLARYVLPVTTPLRAAGAGLLWGALPCGLVYSAVAMAATTGTPWQGALVMFAFWLGTLPALLLAGASARQLMQWKSRRSFRRAAGIIMILIGVLALAPVGKKAVGRMHEASMIGSIAHEKPACMWYKPENTSPDRLPCLRHPGRPSTAVRLIANSPKRGLLV